MLRKFIFDKKIEPEKLTKMLRITTGELENLLSQEKVKVDAKLIDKVNLPLIKLNYLMPLINIVALLQNN